MAKEAPLTFLFILAVVVSGFQLFRTFRRAGNGLCITPGLIFDFLFAGVLLSSVFGIVLLELGRFSVVNLTFALGVFSAAALLAKQFAPVSFSLRPNRRQLLLIAILLLAAILRYPPSNWVIGGQDQGVYVNVGNNMSQTGKIFIQDELLSEIADDEAVRAYYLANTYKHRETVVPGKAEGEYTPGFYVQETDKGIIVPQFYHLHPLWFGISHSLLGVEHTTMPLFVFSLVAVVLMYRMAGLLLDSSWATLFATAYLAVNPLHTYMSRVPVSEVTASMFMMGGLYYLIRASGQKESRAFTTLVAILSFGCLFFTRISGFAYVPFLILVLLLVRALDGNSARRAAITYALFGILAFYAYSYFHGYIFSFPYTFDIFRLKMGIDITAFSQPAFAIGVGAMVTAMAYLAGRYGSWIKRLVAGIEGRKSLIVLIAICISLAFIAYRGYIFAFTDRYPDRLWKIAGTGVTAYRHFNIVVLARMMSPVAFLISLYGMYRLLTDWRSGYRKFLVGAMALYFFVVYDFFYYKTPYLYYYARYLLSEVVPLFTVCVAVGLLQIRNKWGPKVLVAAILLIVIPSLGLPLQAREVDRDATYSDLREIDSVFKGNPIVFLDKDVIPQPSCLVAPLRFTFDRKVFLFDREDLLSGELDHILNFFVKRGYEPYLVSNDEGLGHRHFAMLRTLPITSWYHRGMDLKVTIYGLTALVEDESNAGLYTGP